MFGKASKMFWKMVRRLRGQKADSPKVRDALHPMRELIRTQGSLRAQKGRLKNVTSTAPNEKKCKSKLDLEMQRQALMITPSFDSRSTIFDDSFLKRLQSTSPFLESGCGGNCLPEDSVYMPLSNIGGESLPEWSFTPEWLLHDYRRSTTVNRYDLESDDELFDQQLSNYALENEENEEAIFEKLITPELASSDSQKKVTKIKVQSSSISASPGRSILSPNLRAPNRSIKTTNEAGSDSLSSEEISGDVLLSPRRQSRAISAVTPEAVRIHLEQTWNDLSLGRSRNLSYGRNLSLSVARSRKFSNWKNLSASRARGISHSPRSTQRENSLSISMALVSFQYALRRSTVAAPTVDDDAFAAKLEEFAEEHERIQEEQWLALERLTPNVGGYKNSL